MSSQVKKLVEFLIDNCPEIFGENIPVHSSSVSDDSLEHTDGSGRALSASHGTSVVSLAVGRSCDGPGGACSRRGGEGNCAQGSPQRLRGRRHHRCAWASPFPVRNGQASDDPEPGRAIPFYCHGGRTVR